jgi:predicted transcriptional regulator
MEITKEQWEKLKKKYYSVENIAYAVGVRRQTIENWKEGKASPSRLASRRLKSIFKKIEKG